MQEYKTIIVALKSASIGSKIHLFYIWLLVKHSTVSSGGLGKITKNQNQLNKGVLLGFISLWKTKKICACHHIDLFLKKSKEYHKQQLQLLFSFVELHAAIYVSTISK